MENIISTIAPLIPPAALPLLIVIISVIWVYYKIQTIKTDRENTKILRDNDSQKIHDDILKLQFKISEIDGKTVKHETIIEDMRQQLAELNTNIVRLSVVVEELSKKLNNKD